MPREDGSQPVVQTRQSGEDLYVYPEGAVKALAAGTARYSRVPAGGARVGEAGVLVRR
ncbi:hypothetical protein [Streptomyces goshikiensis]|uniref:hypothetical protein n=1 Tax=Streptomyces goshikiensis TaxID=1942 RepID=UPI00364AF640